MSGDCNIYGGFVVGNSPPSPSETVSWGNIKGDISNQKDLKIELDKKVENESGKKLSSNDFTDENKQKLDKLNTTVISTLSPTKWVNLKDDIYTQTVLLGGIKSEDSVIADIILDEDESISKEETDCWNKILKIEINNGSIKAYYQGIPPDILLNIKIKI